MMRPLEGLRVVDLTHALSGPFCTYQLGLLGADIIKLEPPGKGDHFRQFLPDCFDAVNGGKRSVSVDLGRDEGQAVLDRLLESADIVVENFKSETSEKLNLRWERFAKRNDRIIACAIRGFASNSAFAGRPAVEWSVQAQMGLTALYLDAKDDPRDLGIGMLDITSGANAASAILAALLERARTGKGRELEVTMADAAMMLFAPHIDAQLKGRRQGKASPRPTVGRFRCKDRQLLIMAPTEKWFAALSQVVGPPFLAEDDRFSTSDARKEHAELLLEELENRLGAHDAEFWEARLLEHGVPAAVVRHFPEAVAAGGICASDSLVDVISYASGRELKAFGSPIADCPGAGVRPIVPSLGADTTTVLRELDYSTIEIERLRAAGII